MNDGGHLDLDQGQGRREGRNLNDSAGRPYLAEAFEVGARNRVKWMVGSNLAISLGLLTLLLRH